MKNKILYLLVFMSISSFMYTQSPVPDDAVLEKVATGFKFTEGPVWNDSLGLLFSDTDGNTIYQWSPADSSTRPYLKPSNNSNGLTFDNQGRLVLTQMGLRRVSRQETDGSITPLVSTYEGKKFNSPNDLVIKSDGAIFFTDPNWNVPGGQQNQELSFQGVFRLSPTGTLTLLDTTFDKPNGICLSPDEKKLYVVASPQGRIYVWDIVDDSIITNKKVLNTTLLNGYGDGMKTDSSGNIYCTGPGGVWIFSPEGVYLDKISVPESPSNCNWGDADRKTLYITARKSLYRIRLAQATDVKTQGSLNDKSYKLYANYPNPFNPSTTIKYTVGTRHGVFVQLKVFDMLGREVSTLVNEEQNAGTYNVKFDAGRLASGTYLYQLTAGDFTQTRKLVLMK